MQQRNYILGLAYTTLYSDTVLAVATIVGDTTVTLRLSLLMILIANSSLDYT